MVERAGERKHALQQQLQAVMMQKESLRMQLAETDHALKELDSAADGTVYKVAGPLLLKADKASVREELEERKKFISLKANTLERSEKRLAEEIGEPERGATVDKKSIRVGG